MTLWQSMLKEIEFEFHNKNNFLQHRTISKTISPNDKVSTQRYLDHVRKNKYCSKKILPKVLDSGIGGPKLTEGYSQGTVQHCHYLMMMRKHLKLNITDFDHITDIGGGYGNFYRMTKRLGYKGNFDIADFPIMHKIQEYYISKHKLDLPNFIGIKDLNPSGKSILFGFHSVNEMPYSDRKILEERYYLYDYVMLLYNDEFDGINNLAYFRNLKGRMSKAFTIEIIDAPLRSNGAFFIGSKRK